MMINDTSTISVPPRRVHLIIGVLIIAAWGLLVLWQRSPYSGLLGHEFLGEHHFSFPLKLSAFLLGWFLMTVAMMLPASMPALIYSVRPTGQLVRDLRFLFWMILGYLLPWVQFGILAFLGDSILHELTETGGLLAVLSTWIAPSIVLASGLYQFTSIKWRCIQQCQPSHAKHSKMEMKSLKNAIGRGAKLGFSCVGSCWSLMLLMFALGHHQLGWMLIMGIIFAGERLTPWGRQLAWLVGSILLISVPFWQLTEFLQG